MTTPDAYAALWQTLVEFADEHGDPTTAARCHAPDQCPFQDQLSDQPLPLVHDDPENLTTWLVTNIVREGTLIARTRGNDGELPLAGFKFNASETSGLLAGALILGHTGSHTDLTEAARTLLRFTPPATQSAVIGELFEQLIGSLLERHRQLVGKKDHA